MAPAAAAAEMLVLEEEEEEEEEEEDQARRGIVLDAARAHERRNKSVEADMAMSCGVCVESVVWRGIREHHACKGGD
mgnify:CR=1 FL=1